MLDIFVFSFDFRRTPEIERKGKEEERPRIWWR